MGGSFPTLINSEDRQENKRKKEKQKRRKKKRKGKKQCVRKKRKENGEREIEDFPGVLTVGAR